MWVAELDHVTHMATQIDVFVDWLNTVLRRMRFACWTDGRVVLSVLVQAVAAVVLDTQHGLIRELLDV